MADGALLRAGLLVALLLVASVVWWAIGRRRGSLRGRDSAELTFGDLASQALTSPGTAASLTRGDRYSLVQFSSRVCSDCRRSRAAWESLVGAYDGVTFAELPAEENIAILTNLNVYSTPVTLVFDADGGLKGTVVGPPKPDEIRALRDSSAAVQQCVAPRNG